LVLWYIGINEKSDCGIIPSEDDLRVSWIQTARKLEACRARRSKLSNSSLSGGSKIILQKEEQLEMSANIYLKLGNFEK